MKKISTLFIKRLLPVLVFMMSQVKAWAIDSTTATTVDNSRNVLTQPWIWIAVAVIVAIKLLGPFSENEKDFIVVRKKAVKKTISAEDRI